ncbi:amino acid transporter [Xanthomonas translucens]
MRSSRDRAGGALNLVLGLVFLGKIALLTSVRNFGALFAFLLLHVAVAWHFRRQGRYVLHGAVPLVGFVILAYVLYSSDRYAKHGSLAWLALGCCVAIGLKLRGRVLQLPAGEALDETHVRATRHDRRHGHTQADTHLHGHAVKPPA